MAESTAERLTRLLALVAYLSENPDVPVAEVARHFGTTEAQVLADVNLLWVSGTPGYLPHDLIDFHAEALDHGRITLTDPRGMDRPLRLSGSEGIALLLALRSLRALLAGEGRTPAAVETALEKLTAVTGPVAERAAAVELSVREDEAVTARLELLKGALARGRRVRLRYVSAADVVTERDVDPLELHADGALWSLRAWCHRAQGERTFRLDRILDARELGEPVSERPAGTRPAPRPGRSGWRAELVLASPARWVSEHVPVESVEDLDEEGTHRVVLRVTDQAWLTNLLLSLGDAVREVCPPELAQDVATRARAALEAYERLQGPLS